MYGIALTNPMIQLFLAQSPSLATGPQADPAESGMPSAAWNVKLAPLEPVCEMMLLGSKARVSNGYRASDIPGPILEWLLQSS